MKPTTFEEANVQLTGGPGILNLPVFRRLESDGTWIVTSCWTLSEAEKLEVLATGCVYLSIQGVTHPPVLLTVAPPWEKSDD